MKYNHLWYSLFWKYVSENNDTIYHTIAVENCTIIQGYRNLQRPFKRNCPLLSPGVSIEVFTIRIFSSLVHLLSSKDDVAKRIKVEWNCIQSQHLIRIVVQCTSNAAKNIPLPLFPRHSIPDGSDLCELPTGRGEATDCRVVYLTRTKGDRTGHQRGTGCRDRTKLDTRGRKSWRIVDRIHEKLAEVKLHLTHLFIVLSVVIIKRTCTRN